MDFDADQLAEIRFAFNELDEDGSGEIGAEEVMHVLKESGFRPTLKEAEEVINAFDEDGNGSIEFDEFVDKMRVRVFGITPEKLEVGRAIEEERRRTVAVGGGGLALGGALGELGELDGFLDGEDARQEGVGAREGEDPLAQSTQAGL